jgi:hypothetical protein
MVILLSLTVINMASRQQYGRDNERKNDAENISRGLEQYYTAHNAYPSTADASSIVAGTLSLPNTDTTSFYYSFNNNTIAFTPTTSSGTTAVSNTTATTQAALSTTTIVYLPMTWSTTNSRWEPCDTSSEECSRYALSYNTEGSGTVLIQSKRQQ